jgi:hypothetical protein
MKTKNGDKIYVICLAGKKGVGFMIDKVEDRISKFRNEAKELFTSIVAYKFFDKFGYFPDFFYTEATRDIKEFKKNEKLFNALKETYEKFGKK